MASDTGKSFSAISALKTSAEFLGGGVAQFGLGTLLDQVFPSEDLMKQFSQRMDQLLDDIEGVLDRHSIRENVSKQHDLFETIKDRISGDIAKKIESGAIDDLVLEQLEDASFQLKGIVEAIAGKGDPNDLRMAGIALHIAAVTLRLAVYQKLAILDPRCPFPEQSWAAERIREIVHEEVQNLSNTVAFWEGSVAQQFEVQIVSYKENPMQIYNPGSDLFAYGILRNGKPFFPRDFNPIQVMLGKRAHDGTRDFRRHHEAQYAGQKRLKEIIQIARQRQVHAKLDNPYAKGGVVRQWEQLLQYPIFGNDVRSGGTPSQDWEIHTFGMDRRFAKGHAWQTAAGYKLSFDDDGGVRLHSKDAGKAPLEFVAPHPDAYELRLPSTGIMTTYNKAGEMLARHEAVAAMGNFEERSVGLHVRYIVNNNGLFECYADPTKGGAQVYMYHIEPQWS